MVNVYRPASLAEALAIRQAESTVVFAGGTDLMVRHRSWSGTLPSFADNLLLVGQLSELQQISVSPAGLVLGAACSLADILGHPAVPASVKRPISEMAAPAIRNLATIGGNICNASPAGDTLPMLYALDARLTLAATGRERTVAIADFIRGPGQTSLQAHEILTRITIPQAEWPLLFYLKAATRRANALAKVSCFGTGRFQAGRLADLRLALGAVSPTVVRSQAAEQSLVGLTAREIDTARPAFLAVLEPLVRPIDDVRSTRAYRQTVARRMADAFLQQLALS